MTTINFKDLGLAECILRALNTHSFVQPTPIQAAAIPPILEGRDLLGLAQTGTGKTAAFALPLLHQLIAQVAGKKERLARYAVRALILAPTRELALQIDAEIKRFAGHSPIRSYAILGGVGRQPQVDRLSRGVDIVVGTPGRICDLMQTKHLRLDQLTHFVLDEADRMFDLGFIRDIRRVVAALPKERQSLLFSATMPDEIADLAGGVLNEPVRVEAARTDIAPSRIDQRVYFVDQANKRALLQDLLSDAAITRAIVFTRTKHGANKVTEHLVKAGVTADAIHGNKGQSARQRALSQFRDGRVRVLVATDIAARGIDVPAVSHVVNFDLPHVPEDYVHRIGRTARNGHEGIALSFCDQSERGDLRAIERLTKRPLTPVQHAGFAPAATAHRSSPHTGPVAEPAQRHRKPGRRDFGRQDQPHRHGQRHEMPEGQRQETRLGQGQNQDRNSRSPQQYSEKPHRAEGKRDGNFRSRKFSNRERNAGGQPDAQSQPRFRGDKPGTHAQGTQAQGTHAQGRSEHGRPENNGRGGDRPYRKPQGQRRGDGRPQNGPQRHRSEKRPDFA